MKDFFQFFGFIFAAIWSIIITGMFVVGSISYTFGQYNCYATGRDLNVDVKWTLYNGCMYNIKGQYLPESLISPFMTKEGKIIFVPKAQIIMMQREHQ